jgi:inosine/xanthosine triphosphate pyrophosphatase family protein
MIEIVYVTSSTFKQEENRVFVDHATLSDGTPVREVFTFRIWPVPIKEVLEVDITTMVIAEVAEAYSQLRIPCIVEHAGLVFSDYLTASYPGGLTKPMWNGLQESFIRETQSAGRRALARAVVAYCDGMSIDTFVGETHGTIAPEPRGERRFYWDTVFVPDMNGSPGSRTYAEIVRDDGIEAKMSGLSQSARAMLKFLDYRRKQPPTKLWPDAA